MYFHARRRPGPSWPADRSTDPITSMHDILSDPYRCAILAYLTECANPADVDELIAAVLEWQSDDRPSDSPQPGSPEAWLRNEHIVHMNEFGVISYDPNAESVRLAEDFSVTLTDRQGETDSFPC